MCDFNTSFRLTIMPHVYVEHNIKAVEYKWDISKVSIECTDV